MSSLDLGSRFWSKVDKGADAANSCWTWTGAKWPGGQGVFNYQGKTRGAHRLVWEAENRPLQKGEFVIQSCELLACVRPEHLRLGTEKDAHRHTGRAGVQNSMFGKKHTPTAKAKMSRSRTGKTGPTATAWKGGLTSLNRRLRGLLHHRLGWYAAVFKRDGWVCQACKVPGQKIDAHHIRPLSGLVRQLLKGQTFKDETEALEWLITQPLIADISLVNGVTLCRKCHKDAHNWGSHTAP